MIKLMYSVRITHFDMSSGKVEESFAARATRGKLILRENHICLYNSLIRLSDLPNTLLICKYQRVLQNGWDRGASKEHLYLDDNKRCNIHT